MRRGRISWLLISVYAIFELDFDIMLIFGRGRSPILFPVTADWS